jgi:hypothetical protein
MIGHFATRPLRILFICGSLESGRDGVGDYTRRLSKELTLKGQVVAIAAINDPYIEEIKESSIIVDDLKISILRLPESSEELGFVRLEEWIEMFEPDLLSLQYVPFSFHPKGLSFKLAKRLKVASQGRKWHIMFHEICVGMHKKTSLKLRLWGMVQKYIAKDLLKQLSPQIVHTHIKVYQKQLEKFGVDAKLLPLFSNIPLIYPQEVDLKMSLKDQQHDTIDLVIFASIQHGAPIRQFAKEARKYEVENKVSLRMVIIGRSGSEQENWVREWKAAGLSVIQLGEQTEEKISEILARSIFGIFTTPLLLVGKSGAVAAMREHKIHLLCLSREWEARGINVRESPYNILQYKEGNLVDFFAEKPDFSIIPTVDTVAKQLILEILTP